MLTSCFSIALLSAVVRVNSSEPVRQMSLHLTATTTRGAITVGAGRVQLSLIYSPGIMVEGPTHDSRGGLDFPPSS